MSGAGVLVTGATTPIGVALVEQLLAAETRAIVAVGRADERHRLPTDSRIRYVAANLTRSRDIRELLFGPVRELAIESIVDAAFHRNISTVGSRAHALNVESTRELLSLAEQHPTLQRFAFFSHVDVYRLEGSNPALIEEDQPLDLSPDAPQRVRDRIEADLTVCARMGMSKLTILVLRCAEVLAADTGSQLYDYLQTRTCLRPLGFDPMLNLLSTADAARALALSAVCNESGILNIPGADTLPLSHVIRLWGSLDVPLPGPLLAPLYRLRASARGLQFRYDVNYRRFHFSTVLDGTRASRILAYRPTHPIAWPRREPQGQTQ